MMNLLKSEKYISMLKGVHEQFPNWSAFDGKCIFLSGASGMIGSLLVDTLMLRNQSQPLGRKSKIIAVARNKPMMEERFAEWQDCNELCIISHDISEPFNIDMVHADYYIHAASTTHPIAYAREPINTMLANFLGAHNMLELASKEINSRFLLLSSVEIYGENCGNKTYFSEEDCGYLNCNTLRAGYPEAKRASESLCQAYIQQKEIDAVIVRLPRTYGPSLRMTDSKAIAQFIKNGVYGEDIVLKSAGNQLYSYAHVADAVIASLYVLLYGKTGEAYNVSDTTSDITLKELAEIVAQYAKTKVIYEQPEAEEQKGYSTATMALMNAKKLKQLGWTPKYTIEKGLYETLEILKEISV